MYPPSANTGPSVALFTVGAAGAIVLTAMAVLFYRKRRVVVKASQASWVAAAVVAGVTTFSVGSLSTLLYNVWLEDSIVAGLLPAVVGLALIVAVPVTVAVSSPVSGALRIATMSGSMLALLFSLFVIGRFVPYWSHWVELEDQDWRDIFPIILVTAAFIGLALGFLGGLAVSAGRYILRVNRRP